MTLTNVHDNNSTSQRPAKVATTKQCNRSQWCV